MTDALNDHVESAIGDNQLIAAVRGGDTEAYAALYERHAGSARGLARQLVRGESEVDDTVSEAFARVLSVVQRGGGPEDGFRPYLLTAVRNAAYDRFRGEKRQFVTDDMEAFDRGEPFVDPALDGLERSLIARAFSSLPERWQAVLWHTEIEGEKPAEVAAVLGMSANSVAALAYRAREGLRQAYLQMHLAGGAPAESCRPALDHLGAYVRGGLAKRDTATVDRHLDGCADCRAVYAELMDVNVALRGVMAPLVLGPAAAAYLAALPGGVLAGGWWGRLPKRQQQAVAAGTAVAVVAASAALAVVSNEEQVRPSPAQPPVAAPPAQPRSDQEPADPPVPDVPAPPPPGDPAPAAPAPPSPAGAPPPAPEESVVLQPPLPSPDPVEEPDRPRPPVGPSAPSEPSPPRFVADIDPVGALVPGRPGIVVLGVLNEGGTTVDDVVADVTLPAGVTLVSSGRAGNAFPVNPADPTVLDGWSCTATVTGAECVRSALDAGADSSAYLDVDVANSAVEGGRPGVSVRSGRVTATAEAANGVDPSGSAARYAAAGRVRGLAVGNSLMTCVDQDDEAASADWPWGVFPRTAPAPADERPAPVRGLVEDAAPSPSTGPEGGGEDEGEPGKADPGHGADPAPGALPAPQQVEPTPDPTTAPGPAPTPEPGPTPSARPLPEPEGPCARALQREGDRRNNDHWDMQHLDLDDDRATASSSSAVWDLPAGGSVRWAGLYFSGVGTPHSPSAKVRGPGADSFTTVRAEEVGTVRFPGFAAYQAFADVTELVRGHGGGEWWVGDVPTRTGYAAYAGWSLVVVVEDPSATVNQAMVLDGTSLVFQGETMEFPLSGLLPAGAQADIDVVAFEGDAGIAGDQVLLNGAALTPQGGDRDPANAFASSSTGAVGPPLTFGTDVVRFSAPLPRSPVLRLVSRGDAYLAGAVAVTAAIRP
ncbi:sigma-70 family RNA polymerase sigma factor [Nocardiopsis ansamitocini]|uniref:RNA polymerase sigma factor (Sigma-70 family) n=1 Tax=Nocardiopsis ansamitocini TaxID=1670832 RepID=A0A9W6P8W1_9ACTN|nr:sigma-70 family RNA polymerase sigma factor [Nocardiopsis ansamitocini]GLU49750.1 hypothetical protein Nans01_41010 [Nocardiopsis ansamitocini]